MSINEWGPLTWIFFHTMAEKIKDKYYDSTKMELLSIIKTICNNLPCPECTEHASIFMGRVQSKHIKTRHDLKVLLYSFHNEVNERTRHPRKKIEYLDVYKRANLFKIITLLPTVYGRRQNNKLFIDHMHRNKAIGGVVKWFSKNMYRFNR